MITNVVYGAIFPFLIMCISHGGDGEHGHGEGHEEGDK